MKDLRDPRAMWVKAILFVIIGITSAGLLWMNSPDFKTGCFIAITIWAFSRAYYFAFYVLEKYADPQFRYAGLFSLLRYIFQHLPKDVPQNPK